MLSAIIEAIMDMIRIILLLTEAFFSILALATENYWLFFPALIAAVYDYMSSRNKK